MRLTDLLCGLTFIQFHAISVLLFVTFALWETPTQGAYLWFFIFWRLSVAY